MYHLLFLNSAIKFNKPGTVSTTSLINIPQITNFGSLSKIYIKFNDVTPWFIYWFSFTLAYSRISHEYSSLFIIVINLIFMFSL